MLDSPDIEGIYSKNKNGYALRVAANYCSVKHIKS